MCAEHGLPLHVPGSPGCYTALMEITDATLLARAMVWMATSDKARSQAYYVTDRCLFRWQWVWPKIADTTSIRLDGFHGVVDTGRQIVGYLEQYRAARLLP